MSMIRLDGCGCRMEGLGEDPPPPVTPADVQAAIAAALANQQLALASQLEAQRRDERAQVMEWQAMRRRAEDADQGTEAEGQWVDGVSNTVIVLVGAGVLGAYLMSRK